jgi:hypothetical protein
VDTTTIRESSQKVATDELLAAACEAMLSTSRTPVFCVQRPTR